MTHHCSRAFWRRGPRPGSFARRGLAVAALPIVLLACSAVPERATTRWISPELREHPLVGVIWQPSTEAVVTRAVLADRLAASDFVLLGDKHDNPDHHRLQAELLAALVQRGRRPAVVFEPITVDRGPALATALAQEPLTAQTIIDAVADAKSGWPWDLYRPILDVALSARLPVKAGDLDPAWVRAVHASGLAGLDPNLIAQLALREPRLSAAARERLADDIRRSHCGHASDAMVARMLDLQRARDAQLAGALTDAVAAGADGAVLIAGAGHVRSDLAVPLDLARWAPDARVVTVAFVEVSPAERAAPETLAAESASPAPFDYVWFTPWVDMTDPCERFRSSLQRMGGVHPPPQ